MRQDITATGAALRQRLTLIGGAVEGLPQYGRRLSRAIDALEQDMRLTRNLCALAGHLDSERSIGHCTLAREINARLDAFEAGYRRIVLGHRKARDETERLMISLMTRRVCDRKISDVLRRYFFIAD